MKYPDDFINQIICGDCLKVMKGMPDNCIETIITDPPYGLKFMGKKWDYKVPSIEIWQECLRVLKPGGTALIFAGSRTQHRMAVNVEDAGFILKDVIEELYEPDAQAFYKKLNNDLRKEFLKLMGGNEMFWLFGSGFPKATDISTMLDKDECRKQLEKKLGRKATKEEFKEAWERFRKIIGYEERFGREGKKANCGFKKEYIGASGTQDQPAMKVIEEPVTTEAKLWNGWKSHGLKPAYEPILVAMKPNEGSYANNAMKWGVAGLNVDGGRIGTETEIHSCGKRTIYGGNSLLESKTRNDKTETRNYGRYPANVILDEEAGAMLDEQAPMTGAFAKVKSGHSGKSKGIYQDYAQRGDDGETFYNDGLQGASRFFYCAKASKAERNRGCEGLEEKTSSERKIMIDRRIYNVEMDKLGKYIKQKREEKGITLKEMNNIFGYVAGCNWWESINKNTQRVISNKDYLKLKDILNLDDRFDYILKTTKEEEKSIVDTPKIKNANHHPTVKPLSLMKYLCTITKSPTGGIVLDPFCGSGTTLMACKERGRKYIGIEIDKEYVEIAQRRLRAIEAVLF